MQHNVTSASAKYKKKDVCAAEVTTSTASIRSSSFMSLCCRTLVLSVNVCDLEGLTINKPSPRDNSFRSMHPMARWPVQRRQELQPATAS